MKNKTGTDQLAALLIEPLKGYKGLYSYKQQLIKRVKQMPDTEIMEHLKRLKSTHHPGT